MNAIVRRMRSAALWLCYFGASGPFGTAVSAQESLVQSSAGDGPPSVLYRDHYIAGGGLTPDISTDDSATSDPTGLARSLRIDGVLSVLTNTGAGAPSRVEENGIVLNSQWDTVSHGAWSADLAERVGGTETGALGSGHGAFTLVERAMPFDGNWNADGGLGDLNGPNINLARFQSRFFLPTGPMQGVTTEWRGPSGAQFVAAAGEPGLYEGIKVPTFETLGGSTETVGAQWSPASQWTVGGQFAEAHDVNLFASALTAEAERESSATGFLSTAWQGPSARAQLSVIDGSTGGARNSFGTWFDAQTARAGNSQGFGAFRIGPDLSWGNQLITDDLQGAYYQFGHQSRRWFADVGIDQAWSVSGLGTDSTFLSSDARYQISRDLGIGAVANVRRSQGALAWALESYVDNRNAWGIGRGQLDYAKSDSESDATITVSQGWDPTARARLSTSIALERIVGTALSPFPQTDTAMSLSMNGGGDLTARLSFDANIRWGINLAGPGAPAIMANAALIWQVARDWTVLTNYYENRIGSWTGLTVASPLAPPTTTSNPAVGQRGIFLTFRYQRSAGQHFVPLGGSPGSGSGRLTGTVYLDANDNGRFDAGEAVAPNITIILDGRYSTLTDSSGHFDFAAVAAGNHVLTVVPDNLPLPWMVNGDGRVEVSVRTRDHTDVSLPVSRHSILTRQLD